MSRRSRASRSEPALRGADYLRCPASSYPIRRDVCLSRQSGQMFRECRQCPESGRQLHLFESPLQIGGGADAPERPKRRGRPRAY